jgi:hypothetical protein
MDKPSTVLRGPGGSRATRPRWHRRDWGRLGLAESVLKGTAFAVAFVALARSAGSALTRPEGGARVAAVGLLVVAEAVLVAAIWDRVTEREITAMVFVLCNNLAHLSLIVALCTAYGAWWAVTPFALLMGTGELTKIAFLHSTGFTVRGHPTSLLIAGTGAFAVLYGLLAVVGVAGP